MKMPKVYEILEKFKNLCRFRGWRASETGDWVEVDREYHNFFWTKHVNPSSFSRVVAKRKCIVKTGLSYKVEEAAYAAWLFSEKPSTSLVKMVLEDPELTSKTAIYDLSPFLEGKNFCIKVNQTKSRVFQEFERFLKKELKVKLEPLSNPRLKNDLENGEITLLQN